MTGRGIAIRVVRGCWGSIDTPQLVLLCFTIVICEMFSPFSGLKILWTSCVPFLLSSKTLWTSYPLILMLWVPVNDSQMDRISNGSEEVPSPKPLLRSKNWGKESVAVWPTWSKIEQETNLRLIPCCQDRSTHTYSHLTHTVPVVPVPSTHATGKIQYSPSEEFRDLQVADIFFSPECHLWYLSCHSNHCAVK
jgi:hypothetical protein